MQLSDGSFFFVLRDVFLDANLGRGDAVDPGLIRRLEERSTEKEAEAKALELLGRGAHSCWALRGKLLRRGFDRDLIERVLERLTAAGYLDDESYAREWLRQRLRRNPGGRPLLLAGLLQRGLERRTAENALDAVFDTETEQEAIRTLLRKLAGRVNLDRAAAERKLRARRFRAQAVREALAGFPGPEVAEHEND